MGPSEPADPGAGPAQPPPAPTPPAPPAPPAPAPPPEPSPEQQLAELRERLVRARADYDNLQKRVARDSALERDRAKARVLEGLLPVYELALMAAHQAQSHPGPISEGIVLLAREFGRVLEREGLTPVNEVGARFDRAVHEAVAQEAADGVSPGHVSRIVQPGYRLGDKVLRYAKVAVAPEPAPGPAPPPSEANSSPPAQ